VLYAKSIHSENTSLWYTPCQQLIQIKPILLTISLMVVMESSRYSIFHDGDTPIWLGLPWQNHFCQCLNTETSAQGNRGYITETLNISYSMNLYIRLVSSMVHTGVKVYRMDSEMSRLVERPWIQLMCCAVCLLHGCNFR